MVIYDLIIKENLTTSDFGHSVAIELYDKVFLYDQITDYHFEVRKSRQNGLLLCLKMVSFREWPMILP